MQRGIASLGANLLVVRPAQVERPVARRERERRDETLPLDDDEAIAALPRSRQRRAGHGRRRTAQARPARRLGAVVGTSPAFPSSATRVASGRFFDDEDEPRRAGASPCSARASPIAASQDPDVVGSRLRLRGTPVRGHRRAGAEGRRRSTARRGRPVVMPIRTAMRRVFQPTVALSRRVRQRVADPRTVDGAERRIGDAAPRAASAGPAAATTSRSRTASRLLRHATQDDLASLKPH